MTEFEALELLKHHSFAHEDTLSNTSEQGFLEM